MVTYYGKWNDQTRLVKTPVKTIQRFLDPANKIPKFIILVKIKKSWYKSKYFVELSTRRSESFLQSCQISFSNFWPGGNLARLSTFLLFQPLPFIWKPPNEFFFSFSFLWFIIIRASFYSDIVSLILSSTNNFDINEINASSHLLENILSAIFQQNFS